MTQQPTCPSCGGAFITPPLQLNASGYSVHVSVEKADGGFLANNIAVYLSARICASCGLASLVAPPGGAAQARGELEQHQVARHVKPESGAKYTCPGIGFRVWPAPPRLPQTPVRGP